MFKGFEKNGKKIWRKSVEERSKILGHLLKTGKTLSKVWGKIEKITIFFFFSHFYADSGGGGRGSTPFFLSFWVCMWYSNYINMFWKKVSEVRRKLIPLIPSLVHVTENIISLIICNHNHCHITGKFDKNVASLVIPCTHRYTYWGPPC